MKTLGCSATFHQGMRHNLSKTRGHDNQETETNMTKTLEEGRSARAAHADRTPNGGQRRHADFPLPVIDRLSRFPGNTISTQRISKLCSLAFLLALSLISAFGSEENPPFKPGPLSADRLKSAARAAGFRVRDQKVDIPRAVRPRLPFASPDYEDPALKALRQAYPLRQVVSEGRDEWQSQLLLKEWVHKAIPGGTPKISYNSAAEILEHAAQGEPFWCTHYTIAYAECAAALGWQVRKIGVDRKHGPEGMGSEHHGVAEVWSNQFRKWVVIDAQSNLHFEKHGVPLSAWEIRAEWLKDGGKLVDHVVGAPPRITRKNPAILFWNHAEDETSIYFWLYVEDRVLANRNKDAEPARLILPQDAANAGLIWYQNGDPGTRGSEIHQGYLRNRFVTSERIEDIYWTVGVTEAALTEVANQTLYFGLDSYCPNRSGYEASTDGVRWEPVKNEKRVAWPLKPNWNSLRLRTAGLGGVTGPETSLLLLLEPLNQH